MSNIKIIVAYCLIGIGIGIELTFIGLIFII